MSQTSKTKTGKHKEYQCIICNDEFRSDRLCQHLKQLKEKQEAPFSRLHNVKVKQTSLIRSDDEICEILQDHL
jgi:hypothetical protein